MPPPARFKLLAFAAVLFLIAFGLSHAFFSTRGTVKSYWHFRSTDTWNGGSTDLGPLARPIPWLAALADGRYRLEDTNTAVYYSRLANFTSSLPGPLSRQLSSQLDLFFPSDSPSHVLSGREAALRILRDDRFKTIWQTDKKPIVDENTNSWKDKNPGWRYNFLDDQTGLEWMEKHFKGSDVEWAWQYMSRPVLKADFLRYLLVLIEGGVYSDVDTQSLVPIDTWGTIRPTYYTSAPLNKYDYAKEPTVIVGVDVDVHELKAEWANYWPRPLGICQWTLSSAPFHPIFLDAVRRVVNATRVVEAWEISRTAEIARIDSAIQAKDEKGGEGGAVQEWNIELSLKELEREKERLQRLTRTGDSMSVMDWTGPGLFSDSVVAYLKARYNIDWARLRGLESPLRIGEVLILPITGFSPGGESDFRAKGPDDEQACVKHNFRGSWKWSGGV